MGRKYIRCLVALVMMLLLSTAACAAANIQVTPINAEETNALLLTCGETHYLIGGSSLQKIEDELKVLDIDTVAGVIVPCLHAEHVAAVEALSEHFQAQIISEGNASQLQDAGITWIECGFRLTDNEKHFAFGVDEAIDGCLSYRCDGSLIPFAAATNESSVNIRQKTSTKSDRVSKIQRGELVIVNSALRNDANEIWYEVETATGKKGYIRSDLLQYVYSEKDFSAGLAQSTEVPETENTKKETRYIGNKKSKVFHRPDCKTLPSGKNQVYFDSRDYAVSKGYRPCNNCKP